MRNKKVLVSSEVSEVGDVALVSIRNRKGHSVEVLIVGVSSGPVSIKVEGNDTYRGAFSVAGPVTVALVGDEGGMLYPLD